MSRKNEVTVTVRVRETMGVVPFETTLNEAVREIAVSLDPSAPGIDLTLASGRQIAITATVEKARPVPSWLDAAAKMNVDGRTITFGARRTGRTTRMLTQVLQYLAMGRPVMVVALSEAQAMELRRQAAELAVHEALLKKCVFTGLPWAVSAGGGWLGQKEYGAAVVAFDHFAAEEDPATVENVRKRLEAVYNGVTILEVIR